MEWEQEEVRPPQHPLVDTRKMLGFPYQLSTCLQQGVQVAGLPPPACNQYKWSRKLLVHWLAKNELLAFRRSATDGHLQRARLWHGVWTPVLLFIASHFSKLVANHTQVLGQGKRGAAGLHIYWNRWWSGPFSYLALQEEHKCQRDGRPLFCSRTNIDYSTYFHRPVRETTG